MNGMQNLLLKVCWTWLQLSIYGLWTSNNDKPNLYTWMLKDQTNQELNPKMIVGEGGLALL